MFVAIFTCPRHPVVRGSENPNSAEVRVPPESAASARWPVAPPPAPRPPPRPPPPRRTASAAAARPSRTASRAEPPVAAPSTGASCGTGTAPPTTAPLPRPRCHTTPPPWRRPAAALPAASSARSPRALSAGQSHRHGNAWIRGGENLPSVNQWYQPNKSVR